MKPRLGLMVRADKTGLGYQTRAYYKWLKPDKTILVDISSLNGNTQYYGWYENRTLIKGLPTNEQVDAILDNIDILLTAETFYNFRIITRAKERGIKTICVDNPEFFDKEPLPDVIILPSTWLEQQIRDWAEPRGTKVIQLHHPIDRSEITYRERTTNKPLHIAGKPAFGDRNGTWDFMRAIPNGRIVTQDVNFANQIRKMYRHSSVYHDVADNNFMYQLGDIMVLPRKYGGNCLPLNEALASGMPVVMPDISPNQTLLPKEWLMPAVFDGTISPRGEYINTYRVEAPAIRDRVLYMQTQDISVLSKKANEIADTIRWENMLDKWNKAIYET